MPHWYYGFCKEIFQGLSKSLITTSITNVKLASELDSSDYVFVTYYKDLAKLKTNAHVLYYHQGSGACPYFEFIDKKQERKDLKKVDLHLFPLPTFEKLVKDYYQLKNTKTIGFPLDLIRYEKYKSVPKKKKIVVSGHITPGKQFYLATYLLKDLIPEYEVWFSVVEWKESAAGMWTQFYNLKSFEEMGFKFRIVTETPGKTTFTGQEKFYEFISDASHVFTCSLADTISLPIVEGALCGAIPIVPNIKSYWGQFMDYIDYGYDPFSKADIMDAITRKTELWDVSPELDTKWFDSRLVVNRLKERLV